MCSRNSQFACNKKSLLFYVNIDSQFQNKFCEFFHLRWYPCFYIFKLAFPMCCSFNVEIYVHFGIRALYGYIHGYPLLFLRIMDISMDIQKYPWIFRIKYFKQSFNCKMTAKLTKYSGITLQLIIFDCLWWLGTVHKLRNMGGGQNSCILNI